MSSRLFESYMRSLRLSSEGVEVARRSLSKKQWSQTALAQKLGIARSTLTRFFSSQPVDSQIFVDICNALELDWQKLVDTQENTDSLFSKAKLEDVEADIDEQVQKARKAIEPYIQVKCGTMRVLDMSQPIGLGKIYTRVNILEKITGRRGLALTDLIGEVDLELFDRFYLGNLRATRFPGLNAVEKYRKLMVLGLPGAGKSTFLKHLAMQCMGGKFQAARVPIFVTLKDFADQPGKPDLLTYLDTYLKKELSLAEVVRRERALLLLDGLDEVREADSSRVLRQIEEISQQFPENQYVITCRIAAQEYRFESFTEVEIADFDDAQIADFSCKWFGNKNDLVKAKRFTQKLKEDKSIRELASSPLLLTLLCLVFEDSGSFPGNRAELYQTGVDVLLKKWDATRNIERDTVYQKLSLKRKQDLLGNVAYTTFKAGNYFFKQGQVERYISQYIENLPGANADPEALEFDSAAVLKSIEAQHGLFVERARGIYSFSHLTFHEYFTAQKLVTRCNPEAIDDPSLLELLSHVTEKRWQEVFLLAVGMLDSADVLLRLMKDRIDGLLAGDEKLQQFLRWVDEKVRSDEAPYKLAAVRAFYLSLSLSLKPDLSQSLDWNLDLDRFLDLDLNLYHSLDLDLNLYLSLDLDLSQSFDIYFDLYLSRSLNRNLNLKLDRVLKTLKTQLPNPESDRESFKSWWQANGEVWREQLRAAMIRYRNIGHDWQFSDTQKKLLEQYYDANKLLADCLNSDCYVSREVRQEMEETLLLPIAQIEQRRK